jgi:preprotein translocase subunit SecG
MTAFILAFLTVILVLNSFFLILLVLIQLPKKDAGIGMAFGAGATEALFGAGSGTVLTRITKYSAGLFMGLSLFLSMMNSASARRADTSLDDELRRLSAGTPPTPALTVPATSEPAPPLELPLTPQPSGSEPLLLSPSDAPLTTPPPLLLEPEPVEPPQ